MANKSSLRYCFSILFNKSEILGSNLVTLPLVETLCMKQKKTCQHCGKEYRSSSSRSKYCSTACRVFAYRKRKNIPDPSYIKKHKLPKKKIQKEVEKKVKKITPEYAQLLEHKNLLTEKHNKLIQYRYRAIQKLNKHIAEKEESYLTADFENFKSSIKNQKEKKLLKRIENYSVELAKMEIWFEKFKRAEKKIKTHTFETEKTTIEVEIPDDSNSHKKYSIEQKFQERAIPLLTNSYKTITLKDSGLRKYKAINFSGTLNDFFGKPALNFNVKIQINRFDYIEKLTTLLNQLSSSYGNIVYASDNESVLDKISSSQQTPPDSFVKPILVESETEVNGLHYIHDAQFLFFDSDDTKLLESLSRYKTVDFSVIFITNTSMPFTEELKELLLQDFNIE